MPSPKTCPECGAVLPQDAPHGLCPRCLLARGIAPMPAGHEPEARDSSATADVQHRLHGQTAAVDSPPATPADETN